MNKTQHNVYITPAAHAAICDMAERLNVSGQRESRFSPFIDRIGLAFAANPVACEILVKLILDDRMITIPEFNALMEAES